MIKIYHNPRCGKSRNAITVLEKNNIEFEIVEYLKDVPTKNELKAIILKLGIAPHDLIRTKESIYKEQFEGKNLSDEEWIDAMIKYPILIERPIVISKSKAIIAREEGKLESFLS